jgi:membrane carboxypeptidase/penicillin-binding protein
MLTIDENIQFMAEHALDHAMERVKALSGTVVIQDTHTGQILALAIRPTYNPNDFRHATTSLLRNHAVSDIYEPGSTFKLVTYSAALDGAGVEPTDIVDCQGGQITLFGRTIHDDASERGLGRITVATALAKSSDVAAVKMALKVGPERFYSYIKAFGFGSRSGIQLPSETRGLLRPPKRWGATSIDSLAIGQEIGVTPLQLVSMVSTIGNGGTAASARGCAPGDIAADFGEDAQNDGRRRFGRQRPQCRVEWLLRRRQDGDGAEDRRRDPYLFPHQAHRLLHRLRAGKQSGNQRGSHHRYANGGQLSRRLCLRASVQGSCAGGAGISRRAAR